MNDIDRKIGKAISEGLKKMVTDLEKLTEGAKILGFRQSLESIDWIYDNGVVWSNNGSGFQLKKYSNKNDFLQFLRKSCMNIKGEWTYELPINNTIN